LPGGSGRIDDSHGRNPIKNLNHRGRRARRDKNGQRLKAQEVREKRVPFPTLPGRPKLPRGFQKRTSALSASSLFILLSSSPEDSEKKRF
jgi:hypothetical protein